MHKKQPRKKLHLINGPIPCVQGVTYNTHDQYASWPSKLDKITYSEKELVHPVLSTLPTHEWIEVRLRNWSEKKQEKFSGFFRTRRGKKYLVFEDDKGYFYRRQRRIKRKVLEGSVFRSLPRPYFNCIYNESAAGGDESSAAQLVVISDRPKLFRRLLYLCSSHDMREQLRGCLAQLTEVSDTVCIDTLRAFHKTTRITYDTTSFDVEADEEELNSLEAFCSFLWTVTRVDVDYSAQDEGNQLVIHSLVDADEVVNRLRFLAYDPVIADQPILAGFKLKESDFISCHLYFLAERIRKAPIRGAASVMQFLGELPESAKSLASVLEGAVEFVKLVKKKDFKRAFYIMLNKLDKRAWRKAGYEGTPTWESLVKAGVGAEFFWSFGLKPMIDDLRALYELSDSVGKQTSTDGYLRRRARSSHKLENVSFSLPVIDHLLLKEVRGEFKGDLVVYLNYGCDIRIKNPLRALLDLCGLNSILGTAWELVPLSFVVDWFLNIGSVIERLTDIETDGIEILNEYRTITIHGKGTTHYQYKIDSEYTLGNFNEEDQVAGHPCEFLTVDRGFYHESLTDSQRIALDVYAPAIQSKFNLSKVATLAELIAQRVL